MKERFSRVTCKDCGYKRDGKIECCPKCAVDKSALLNAKNPLENLDWLKCVLICIFAAVSQIVITGVGSVVAAFTMGGNPLENLEKAVFDPGVMLVSSTIATIVSIVAILFVIRRYLIPLALSIKKYKNVLFGFLIGAVVIGINTLYGAIFGTNTNENQNMVIGQASGSAFLFVLSTAFLAPIFEELVFRVAGYGFFSKISKPLAYVVSTVLFALIHVNFSGANLTAELISFPTYLLAGVGLAFAYDKFGFWGSATMHVTNNLFASIVILATL